MAFEILRAGVQFFVRRSATTGAICWQYKEERWVGEPATIPPGAVAVALDELPPDLREELLAFVARAEALGNQVWSRDN